MAMESTFGETRATPVTVMMECDPVSTQIESCVEVGKKVNL
jgi:hypothetical protein